MQEKIIKLLRKSDGFVSGEEISRQLNVSRSAVWKAINALRAQGYQIESVTNRGYHLKETPDVVSAVEIKNGLRAFVIGQNIVSLQSVDSTNEEAKRQAQKGAPHGSVFVAEEQTLGKGRLGRHWIAEPQTGAWMSVLLRPDLGVRDVMQITLIAGLAVSRAITGLCGCNAQIKWPNDVVINGKKVCGILTEMAAESECIHYLVIGIGVNVNHRAFPEEISHKATSLFLETGKAIPRAAVVRAVLEELEILYDQFVASPFEDILSAYRKNCVTLGRRVSFQRQEETYSGIAEDVNEEGDLLVRLSGGELIRVNSGEVTVQGIYRQGER